jgi:hypothetical protein
MQSSTICATPLPKGSERDSDQLTHHGDGDAEHDCRAPEPDGEVKLVSTHGLEAHRKSEQSAAGAEQRHGQRKFEEGSHRLPNPFLWNLLRPLRMRW